MTKGAMEVKDSLWRVLEGHGAETNKINEENLFGGVAYAEDVVTASTLETIDSAGGANGVSLTYIKAEREQRVGKRGSVVGFLNDDRASGGVDDRGPKAKDQDCSPVGAKDRGFDREEGGEVLPLLEIVAGGPAVQNNCVSHSGINAEECLFGDGGVGFFQQALCIGCGFGRIELVTVGGGVACAFRVVHTVGAERPAPSLSVIGCGTRSALYR
jgi:hypothetical protein